MEAKELRSPHRQVDDTIGGKRSAIVDAHDDRAAILQIGDARVARHRQGGMRGRDAMHVVDFAVGGEPAVEIRAIPRGGTVSAIIRILGRHIGAPVDVVGLADPIGAAALRHRLAVLDHLRAVLGFLAELVRDRTMGERQRAEDERADARDPAASQRRGMPPHHVPTPQPSPPPCPPTLAAPGKMRAQTLRIGRVPSVATSPLIHPIHPIWPCDRGGNGARQRRPREWDGFVLEPSSRPSLLSEHHLLRTPGPAFRYHALGR